MRWAPWAIVATVLIGGCAPTVEQAAAPGPSVDKGPAPLGGPSAAARVWGYQPAKRIRGRVTAVAPQTGLVVLDVGEIDGVRERYAFTVYRDETYVGKVVVCAVFPDYCAARYGEGMRADVAVGDAAATRLLIDF